MKNLTLNIEEQDILQVILSDGNFKPLEKVLLNILENHTHRMRTYNLKEGSEGLVILKAQNEGVDHTIVALKAWKEKLTNPAKETNKNVRRK
jgi:predicted DNA-binding antitoxin AbrB/MazE fold protein